MLGAFFEEPTLVAMDSAGFLNVSELFQDPVFTASLDLISDRSAKFAQPDLDTLSLIDRKHCSKQDLVLGGNLGN